jgi:hypothetical protein
MRRVAMACVERTHAQDSGGLLGRAAVEAREPPQRDHQEQSSNVAALAIAMRAIRNSCLRAVQCAIRRPPRPVMATETTVARFGDGRSA